ncbi:unnamed protein product [Triticum turgidum subsp. durum]|uniref:RBR-type E3 ubiquitin transferase n=1 Tax=Triticum turgidum subsp. durum TaxID=4567 RepID=A0A9R0X9V8_TRITD|nr:unnamed protein product [Triticum turgidum subsp. durum]
MSLRICICSCRMDDDFAAAEAEQLEEVLRLSAQSTTMACAVCRLMTVSLEASWKPENCDHVICIDCFAKYTTETVATEMPKCPVASCEYHVDPEIHEFMEVDDDGSLIAIKEIDDGKGKEHPYNGLQESGQGSVRSTMMCAVCRLMIVSLEASWKPENCDHIICITCFARYTTESTATEMPKCPITSCDSLLKPDTPQVINTDDDGDAGSSSSTRVVDKDKQPCNAVLQELGQCSSGTTIANDFYCTICMEEVPAIECFPMDGCTHAFCVSCVRQYIAAKVEENVLPIRCPDPGCKDGTLQPEACRDVIPTPLFQRWGAALCDMALEGIKFYCPFNDCSTLLVDDHQDGDAVIRDVECPHCSRIFCAQCKVPWHDGVDCAEFQRLGEDERGREDLLLRKVAQESKWRRCAKCKIYVERVEGCVYIVCRCGHHFCYLCGSAMVKGNHRCSKCKRTW